MSTISREFLSESTNGSFINVIASGTPGTLVHTATNTADEVDEVWLWGVNNTGATASVAIEWSGTDDVTDIQQVGIPSAQGDQLLVAGKTIAGGLAIRSYTDAATATSSGVNIGGHVNRITS